LYLQATGTSDERTDTTTTLSIQISGGLDQTLTWLPLAQPTVAEPLPYLLSGTVSLSLSLTDQIALAQSPKTVPVGCLIHVSKILPLLQG